MNMRLRSPALAGIVLAAAGLTACASDVSSGHDGPAAPPDATYLGRLLLPNASVPIHYKMVDGAPRWQDDIDLQRADVSEAGLQPESFTIGSRTAMFAAGRMWSGANIPYRFDSSITSAYGVTIRQAIAEWQSKTIMTFTYDATSSAPDYILFTSDNTGCHTNLGHIAGANVVHIQDPAATGFGCFKQQITHEIGHVVGLQHEMNRPDRDSFVTIQWANICSGQASNATEQCGGNDRRSQFDDTVPGTAVGTFDFNSIMLYAAKVSDPTFAVNTALPIITKLDGTTYPAPGSQLLTSGDVAGVETLYPLTAAPTFIDVSPYLGSRLGGDTVTVNGTNFDVGGGTQVFFGGVPGTNVQCSSMSSCTVVTPPGSGEEPVTVTVNDVLASPNPYPQTFYYTPSVLSVTPATAHVGDTVTVAGLGFVAGEMSISFGGVPATTVTSSAPGTQLGAINAVVPPGGGVVHVVASVNGQTTAQTSADLFSYGGITVTAMDRNKGAITGGTLIGITGTGFDPCTGGSAAGTSMQVTFGGTPATTVWCSSNTRVVVLSPTVSSTGPVDVRVTAYGQTSAPNSADVFTYTASPVLAGIATVWSASNTLSGGISLDSNAPAGGAYVTVASTAPSLVNPPSPVFIPAGTRSVSFDIPTATPATNDAATLTATYNGSTASTDVQPVPPTCPATKPYCDAIGSCATVLACNTANGCTPAMARAHTCM
jgi:hypothetical protein